MKSLQAGFSLTELMVVVAIIGVLASIAIPNYQRFQARSRQGEAKVFLSTAFTAEQSFSAEWGTFSMCLTRIGADATKNKRRYYNVGWATDVVVPSTCGMQGNLGCNAYTFSGISVGLLCGPAGLPQMNETFVPSTAWANAAYNDVNSQLQYVIGQNVFQILASGSISAAYQGYDIWSIDQDKALVNATPGL